MAATNLVNPPADGRGSPGDGPGMFAVDPLGALYYCCKPYDGVSKIWLMTTTTIFVQLRPPAVPVITNCSATLPPLIRGTLSTLAQNGYRIKVSVSGILKTPSSSAIGVTSFNGSRIDVTGNNWSYQVPSPGMYPYSPGVWEITATSMFEDLNGGGASYSSAASSKFTVTLLSPPSPPPPLPTITANATMAYDKKSAYMYWYSTNTTSLKLNGGTYVNYTLTPTVAVGLGLTITKSGNYTFTATGPGGSTTIVQAISLVGA